MHFGWAESVRRQAAARHLELLSELGLQPANDHTISSWHAQGQTRVNGLATGPPLEALPKKKEIIILRYDTSATPVMPATLPFVETGTWRDFLSSEREKKTDATTKQHIKTTNSSSRSVMETSSTEFSSEFRATTPVQPPDTRDEASEGVLHDDQLLKETP